MPCASWVCGRAFSIPPSMPAPWPRLSARPQGELDLLYIAPERLTQSRTLDLLKRCEIALFAIDEALRVAVGP